GRGGGRRRAAANAQQGAGNRRGWRGARPPRCRDARGGTAPRRGCWEWGTLRPDGRRAPPGCDEAERKEPPALAVPAEEEDEEARCEGLVKLPPSAWVWGWPSPWHWPELPGPAPRW